MSLDEKRPLHSLPDWPQAMDARTAADYAGISRSLFDRLRPVQARYIGGAPRYLRRELDAWLQSLPTTPPTAIDGGGQADAGSGGNKRSPQQGDPGKAGHAAPWVQRLHDRQAQGA